MRGVHFYIQIDISAENSCQFVSHQGKKVGLFHNAAADYDSFWRERHDEIVQSQRQVVRLCFHA